jgi:hypothetical protein
LEVGDELQILAEGRNAEKLTAFFEDTDWGSFENRFDKLSNSASAGTTGFILKMGEMGRNCQVITPDGAEIIFR